MAQVYQFASPAVESAEMSLEYGTAVAVITYTDADGDPVNPTGTARLYARAVVGSPWVEQAQSAADEWRFNGPCVQVRVDMGAVSGFTGYRVSVWRGSQSVDLQRVGDPVETQTRGETNAERGRQYEASRRVTGLASGAVLDSILLTGADPVILTERLIGYTGDGVIASIYEAPTYTGGTADAYYNLSRSNPASSAVQILAGPGLTVSATGVKAFADDFMIGNTSNQGRGGMRPTGHGRELKPNTAYLLRQVMLSAQDISAYITWYSGPLRLPFTRAPL